MTGSLQIESQPTAQSLNSGALRPAATTPQQTLADRFPTLDLFERLATARREISGAIVFTTSFGIEDQAIAHAIFAQDLAIDVVTLDTGRLFPDTYQVWAETEQRYGRRIRAFFPEHRDVEAWIARHGID